MKRLIAITVVVALSLATLGTRAMDMKGMEMKGMDMKGMEPDKKGQDKVHKGAGSVTTVDQSGGKVTIAHGPIKDLNWPAMTMTFGVKDKALLDKVQPGAKVEFSFVQSGKDYLITEIKK